MKLKQILFVLFMLCLSMSKGIGQDVKFNLGGFINPTRLPAGLNLKLVDLSQINSSEFSRPKTNQRIKRVKSNVRSSELFTSGKGGFRPREASSYRYVSKKSSPGLDFLGEIAVGFLKMAVR